MVQFNLLPDIKMHYLRAKRQKQLVNVISFLVACGSLVILFFSFSYVKIAQRAHLNDLNDDIKKYSDDLRNTPDLDKVLTIQNQLQSLPGLLEKRPVASRLFTYISQVTPKSVTISSYNVDFVNSKISVKGAADSIEIINKYVDTYKFTKYVVGDDTSTSAAAFSKVVLSTFGRDSKNANYEIGLDFDPAIFDGTKAIKLVVPNAITTRSQTEQPTQLFKAETEGQ